MPRPFLAHASYITLLSLAVTSAATAQVRRAGSVRSAPQRIGSAHDIQLVLVSAESGAPIVDAQMAAGRPNAPLRPVRFDRTSGAYLFRVSGSKAIIELAAGGPTQTVELTLDRRSPLTAVELAIRADGRMTTRSVDLVHTVTEAAGPVTPIVEGADACADATVITGSGTFRFDTTGATTDDDVAAGCVAFGTAVIERDVWFRWNSDCDGPVTVSTCDGTALDTRLAVYDGVRCAADDLITCDDDGCGEQSRLTFAAARGASYLIRVGMFPGADPGLGTLRITTPCDSAPAGADRCDAATPVAGLGTFAFDNSHATGDDAGRGACAGTDDTGIDRDVWFCWTSDIDGPVVLSLCDQTATDTRVAVYDGCGCPDMNRSPLACDDDSCGLQSSVTFNARRGGRYLLRIGVFPGSAPGSGAFTLSRGDAAGRIAGDSCIDAMPVRGTGLFAFDGTTASSGGPEPVVCTFFGTARFEQDVWFRWTAERDGTFEASTCGLTNVDTRLAVYDGDACPTRTTTPIACNDDACGLQSSVTFTASRNTTYLVRVGAFAERGGGTGLLALRPAERPSTCCMPRRSGQTGCEDPTCQAAVCEVDPFCCDSSWDELCAEHAAAYCGTCVDDGRRNTCDAAVGCQMPSAAGAGSTRTIGATSDSADGTAAADGFRLQSAETISTVCFHGGTIDDACAARATERFSITYYTSNPDNGGPDIVTAGPFVASAPATATGRTLLTSGGPLEEQRYQITHPAVHLEAGCYWIRIVNTSRSACTWRWLTAERGDGRSARRQGDGAWLTTDFDLAFCLDVPIADDGCGWEVTCSDDDPEAGDCCVTHESPGCESADCCNLVCAADPFCCDAAWDQRCAEAAATLCDTTCAAGGNDRAAGALNIPVPSVTAGSTADARAASAPRPCGAGRGPGRWFAVIGTGGRLTASLCPPAQTGGCCIASDLAGCDDGRCARLVCREDPFCCATAWDDRCVDRAHDLCDTSCPAPGFDARLTIFRVTGDGLVCEAGDDDTCGLLPEATWSSIAGVRYLVLVHGFADATGPFELVIDD